MKKIILTLLLCLPCLLFAKPPKLSSKTVQLKKLNRQIKQLQQSIAQAKDKRSTVYQELKQTDLRIAKYSTDLRQINQELKQEKNTLAKLQQQARLQQISLAQHTQLLSKQVRSAYMLGQFQPLKIILNQENPNRLSRLLTYYAYINKARVSIIQKINTTLGDLLTSKQAILQHTEQLQHLQNQQAKQRTELSQEQRYRQRVIKQLDATIQTKAQRLANTKQNKANLEKLIQQLKARSPFLQAVLPLRQMRGKLPWPTLGKITHWFGSAINNTQLKYNGIFIKAAQDKPIRSIYPGKVVFANWLRGFGLLMIVEHGQGMMSLYAHNHALYKKRGDIVDSGDLLATVGHSGSDQNNGLYFELRRNGKPINPIPWLRSRT